MRHEIVDLEALRQFAIRKAAEVGGARVLFLLEGPMGSGKTQFVRELVAALGGEQTCSPTFAIHNHYSTPRGAVEHFDLFRLESEDDLESTGFWDFFRQGAGFVVIEWADRLRELGLENQLPRGWQRRKLVFSISENSTTRLIEEF